MAKKRGEVTFMEPIFEIKTETKKDNYAKFVISPLVSGYGHTLGVSLRRVLLSSLSGAAVTSVNISGVRHQFSTLKGMKEDVLDFLLNLKKVKFIYEGDEPVKVELSAKTAGEVKASDIKTPSGVEVANGDLVLAHLSKGGKLEAEITVEKGIGYSPAEGRKTDKLGEILLDANFSPVERINYNVSETRVGSVTDYDKLTFEIWTDGSLEPKEALTKGARVLSSYLNQIINPQETKEDEVGDEKVSSLGSVGKLSVEEIGLPTRVANALNKAGFDTVEKLSKAEDEQLTKVRNLGEKSLEIIDEALQKKGVGRNA